MELAIRIASSAVSNVRTDRTGPKDLFAGDRHVGGDGGKNRWRHELAGAEIECRTAMRNRRAIAGRGRDVADDLFQMLRRDDRADLCFGIKRIADLDLLRKCCDAGDHILSNILVDDQTRTGIAAFAGIEIGAENSRIDEIVEIGIRKDDLRVLAAKFQRHLLQGLRRIGHGQLADPGRACEGDHIDIRVRGHDRADIRAGTGDDIDDTRRDACSLENLAQHERRAGGELRRLDHRCATGRQRKGQLLADDEERKIPRRDDRDDADRFAQHDAERAVTQRIVAFAVQVAGERCGIAPDIGSTTEFGFGLADRLAALDAIDIGQFIGPCRNHVGSLQENKRALRGRHARPGAIVKRLACGRDRPLGIGFRRGRIAADGDAMAGRDALQRPALGRVLPFAIDQHLEIAHCHIGQSLGLHQNRHYHSPLNSAGRLPAKAATPSFMSPVLAARIEPSASTAVPLSSPLADAIISLQISSAAGPRLAMRPA